MWYDIVMLSGCGIDLKKEPQMVPYTIRELNEASEELAKALRRGEVENPQEYTIFKKEDGTEYAVWYPYMPLIITRTI